MQTLNTLELDTLFDTIPNPVFIKDENLRYIFVNKAYEKMFKVKKRHILGKQVLDLEYLPESDRLAYQNEAREMMEHQKTSHHIYSYAYQGKTLHTCLYWSAGFAQQDGTRGVIGIIVDINRQSKEIQHLRKQVRVINSEKKAVARKSKIDALTGLYARSAFDDALHKLSTGATRGFSCIMLDIDHFKRVNDSFGHMAGDAVLAEVASVLKQCVRKRDLACRYGGEEFVVLLPGTGLSVAMNIAERMRRGVLEKVRVPDGNHVTISAGCSEYMQGEAGTSAVQRADTALYAAKDSGRNRVCSAQGMCVH
jgi:diguanylate cyclase (GGDEF)-like protein/PAS domain S-box-containing protein